MWLQYRVGVIKPLTTETGAGEEFLKSAGSSAGTSAGNEGSAGRTAGSSAGTSAGKEGNAGRSAGSSAPLLSSTGPGTASSTPPGTPLVPGTGPGTASSTFKKFLSGTRFCGQRLCKVGGPKWTEMFSKHGHQSLHWVHA